jgi:hypothetical protein
MDEIAAFRFGYSKNRKMAQERKDPSTLPVFDKVSRGQKYLPIRSPFRPAIPRLNLIA